MIEKEIVEVDQDGEERLDHWLQEYLPDVSRTKLVKWMQTGAVTVNGEIVKKNYKVKAGDKIEILEQPIPEPMHVDPEEMDLNIIYEDEDLLVIKKPKDIVVHPGSGVRHGTLVAGLLHHCKELSGVNGDLRPGIVHRLDKDTTGLMVVAKNDYAHVHLADQLKDRSLSRVYHTVVWGHPYPAEDRIENNVARDPRHRIKMKVQREGKVAITNYKVLNYYASAALVRVKLQTGRTHQIRVHMQNLGFPILGDNLYGGDKNLLNRCEPLDKPKMIKAMSMVTSQALMASEISFIHPRTKETMSFEIPLEGEIKDLIDYLSEA
jgi:23S rRNA pseudouridine1911/1915/1917 synthase